MRAKNKTKIREFVALVAVVGGILFTPQTTFADENTTVKINTNISDVQSTCYIFGGGSSDTTCPSTYGTFDASSNTLTLGTGLNDIDSSVVISSPSAVILKSTGNISSSLVTNITDGTYERNSIIFDFGNYTFTDKGSTVNENTSSSLTYSIFDDTDLTIKNGVMNVRYLPCNDITINGGEIDIYDADQEGRAGLWGIYGDDDVDFDDLHGNFTMTGGKLIIDTEAYQFFVADNFNVSGGTINLKSSTDSSYESGIYFLKNAVISGGNISVISSTDGPESGIVAAGENGILTISGGNITVSGYETGVGCNGGGNSKVFFNGGYLDIKDSSHYAVYVESDDPANAINFADGVKVIEGYPVVYDFEHNHATISPAGGATISATSTPNPDNGDSDDSSSSSDSDESTDSISEFNSNSEDDIAAPDTGANSGSDSDDGLVPHFLDIAIISIVAVCYVAYQFKNHQKKERNERQK